ncbi:hypothetical protein MBLNU459_g7157t1 [Dothideomycetes sp. NU459]
MAPNSRLHKDATLRDATPSESSFRKDTAAEHFAQFVVDKDMRGHKRELPGNEVTVMSLNELAAERRRGFFYHLLTREGWKKWPRVELLPESRRHSVPGACYPNMLYMDYVWSDEAHAAFQATPSRNRYLICDATMNPPPADTPLYAVQYVVHKIHPVYVTPRDSLVVFATDSCFYLAKTSQLDDPAVLGHWRSRRPPAGRDPDQRLATCPYLWETAGVTAGPGVASDWTVERAAMQPFSLDSLVELYEAFVKCCRLDHMAPTFDARQLGLVLPRPLDPERGLPLGTPLGDAKLFSDPPSTRGRPHPGRGRGRGAGSVLGKRRGDRDRAVSSPPSPRAERGRGRGRSLLQAARELRSAER